MTQGTGLSLIVAPALPWLRLSIWQPAAARATGLPINRVPAQVCSSGQAMNPPAEKRFAYHRIVRRGLTGNEYYDPAYGITTTGPEDYAPKIDAWAILCYTPEKGWHPRYRKAEGSGLLPRFVP